jgi:polar amino acid transport system substrate-binding protein
MPTLSSRPRLGRALAALGVACVLAVSLSACQPETTVDEPVSRYVTEGRLTVATAEPAVEPWVVGDAPESGEGFEAAVAYAVAEKLGFARDDVVWVRTGVDEAIAPGPTSFDINIQQFAITAERAAVVDFSSPYYEAAQVVITVEGSAAAGAASLADLAGLRIGAATGTTSIDAVEQIIAPAAGAQSFASTEEAVLALQSAAIDAIVVDLPTAVSLTGAELGDGLIIGQLPKLDGTNGDDLALLLPKGSPLTAEVTAAVDALRADGTLAALAEQWLTTAGTLPLLG